MTLLTEDNDLPADRVLGMPVELIEPYFSSHYGGNASQHMWAAVVFSNAINNCTLPPTAEFTLRLNGSALPSTSPDDAMFTGTDWQRDSDFTLYASSGFASLQQALYKVRTCEVCRIPP